jgi:methylthioribose-1-phosphate isomerase
MRTIQWQKRRVKTIDQTRLPHETVYIELTTCDDVADAIKTMKIRGAPLLGAAAAYALALAACNSKAKTKDSLLKDLEKAATTIRATRPTAVNLFWGVERIMREAKSFRGNADELAKLVVQEAEKIAAEDCEVNRRIGLNGSKLVGSGDAILTHCNAGELATVEYGTALSVVCAAWNEGKKIKVIATETRPLLQGARLTTYELKAKGIPVTLITDNMVGHVMREGLVDKVIVGADRIVRDAVINKIGTFTIAVVAKEHKVPFYVAAPKSTFDLSHRAADVTIEERKPEEVTHVGSRRIVPEGIAVMNPAFDVTPLKYVTGIITEDGVLTDRNFRKFGQKVDD